MEDFAFWVHCAVLSAAFIAYYRFTERSSEAKSLAEVVKTTGDKLQTGIAECLRSHLKPVFDATPSAELMNQIVDELGKPFFTHHNLPQDTRSFQDSLSEFVREKVSPLCDFVVLRKAHARWSSAVSSRGWICFATLIWELVIVAYISLFKEVLHAEVPGFILTGSLVFTATLVIAFFAVTSSALHYHNQVSSLASNNV